MDRFLHVAPPLNPTMILRLLVLLAASVRLIHAQFSPATIPLAVRTPYLNCWVDRINSSVSLRNWPMHWTHSNIMGWSGLIRVDDSTWQMFGSAPGFNFTTILSTEITATRSIFIMSAGPMQVTLTFFSPIELADLVRQSIPFSYVYVDATATDGRSHAVQLYSDISGEWISGNRQNQMRWKTTQTNSIIYHQAMQVEPQPMQETVNIAEDSTVYYGMVLRPDMTWQSGKDTDMRGQFGRTGRMANVEDANFRAINERFAVFSIAVDLGTISRTPSSVVWSLGLVRDPTMQYAGDVPDRRRRSYFWTRYPIIERVIEAFINDFDNARSRAIALDERVSNDARAISETYANLVSVAARQVMAATDLSVSMDTNGQWDQSSIRMFMKDMGVGRRTNPAETMYASFPMFLYLNASIAGLLLESSLHYQASEFYQNPYAAPDLGTTFPTALGNVADTESRGVENTGNMLVMTLAHAKISGDGSLIRRYYPLLQQWADYLVSKALTPTDQTTADNQSNTNMTNLAIKGIIGIQAMSEVSRALGINNDTQRYAAYASSYVQQWADFAMQSGHLTSTYGNASSSGLMYNLYADKLLRTNLVNQSVYDSQTAFYSSRTSSAGRFGLEFDSNSGGRARADWTIFTAATVSDATTRDQFVSMVYDRANFGEVGGALPVAYDVATGVSPEGGGRASPALGAMYALLALNLEHQPIVVPSSGQSQAVPTTNVGAIAGGVVGSVALVVLLVVGLFLWRRRNRKRQPKVVQFTSQPSGQDMSAYDSALSGLAPTVLGSQLPLHGNQRYTTQGSSATLTWTPDDGPVSALSPSTPGSSSTVPFGSHHPQPPITSSPARNAHPSRLGSKQSGPPGSLLPNSAGVDQQPAENTLQLRNEVETLRRQMEEIRASQREYGTDVAPPQYVV